MTDREFLELVERELRDVAATLHHIGKGKNGAQTCAVRSPQCRRCRLERLADDAADRVWCAA